MEHQATNLFMRRYAHETAVPIQHLWHNCHTETDVSCRFGGNRLVLEIAYLLRQCSRSHVDIKTRTK